MRNGDKIRSMKNEELANLFAGKEEKELTCPVEPEQAECLHKPGCMCFDCFIKWLNAEEVT